MKRYQEQSNIVNEIVAKFEEPGADADDADDDARAARQNEITELVAKVREEGVFSFYVEPSIRFPADRSCSCLLWVQMNDCGAPPKEIMGDMPPGELLSRIPPTE